MTTRVVMLTTVDNPFDPFDDYDEWYAYDSREGHHTPGFLARIAVVSEDISDVDFAKAIEDAIDEIVEENVTGLYRKLVREIEEDPVDTSAA